MKDRRAIQTSKAPKPGAAFSQAVVANGFVFVAQVGFSPVTGKSAGGTIELQTRQALENIKAILEAAGTDLAHVAKTTCYLADLADFDRFNSVYRDYFPVDPPSRCTLQVGIGAGLLVEIEAVATIIG